MNKRQRSPNYPSLSLKEAVEKARMLHDSIGQHATSREVVATSMGYRGISGTSATAISALNKYGLIEGRGEEIRVSDRALKIVRPLTDEERIDALREAAFGPPLFRELAEKFPGKIPVDDVLKNYLIRNKFTPQSVDDVISAYKETLEFVGGGSSGYDSGESQPLEPPPMQQPPQPVLPPSGALHLGLASHEQSVGPGKFRVSVDDDFRIGITARRLDQDGIERLIKWLQANKALAPHSTPPGDEDVSDLENDDKHYARR